MGLQSADLSVGYSASSEWTHLLRGVKCGAYVDVAFRQNSLGRLR